MSKPIKENNKLIIIVGNIGMGKSMLAARLAKEGMCIVNMDTIQTMIAGGGIWKL